MDDSQKIMLGDRSQTEKSTLCVIPFIWNSKQVTVIYGDRSWNQQSSVEGGEPSGEKEMFYVLMGVVVTQVYTFVKTPLIIHFRSVHFTAYNYSLILKHARESQ